MKIGLFTSKIKAENYYIDKNVLVLEVTDDIIEALQVEEMYKKIYEK